MQLYVKAPLVGDTYNVIFFCEKYWAGYEI